MKPVPIAVAACILAAAALCPPARALPQSPPHGVRGAAQAPLLLPVRYHRHRYYYRRHNESSAAAATDADAGAIKPGQWEFAAQIEAAALPPQDSTAAPGAASVSGGATKTTYATCVAADKAVPSAFVAGCRLDAVHRDGGRITWSMTCTNRQNAVRSDGVAQYRGDTMTATMVSHLPSAKTGGKSMDVAQRITGHYLGPCPSAGTANATATTATGTSTPSAPATAAATAAAATPASNPAERATAAAAETEASTAAPAEASAAPPAEEHEARHYRRYRRHWRHYARRHRRYGYFGGGHASGFGPSPYSANGY